MGHSHSKHREYERRATSAPPERPLVDYNFRNAEPGLGLIEIVDGTLPMDGLTDEEQANLYWNCILVEAPPDGTNDYAETFPYHTHQKKRRSLDRDVDEQTKSEQSGKEQARTSAPQRAPARVRTEDWNFKRIDTRRQYTHTAGIKETDFAFRSPTPRLRHTSRTTTPSPLLLSPVSYKKNDEVAEAARGIMRGGSGGDADLDSPNDSAMLYQRHRRREHHGHQKTSKVLHSPEAPMFENERSSSEEAINIRCRHGSPPADNQFAPPQTPTEMTWSSVLNQVLSSPMIDPCVISSIQTQLLSPDAQVSLQTAKLIPNFSRPVYANTFYGRHSSTPPIVREPRQTSSDLQGESGATSGPFNELVIGIPTSETRPPIPPWDRSRPTGLANEDEYAQLFPSDASDTTISPEERVKLHEVTIATQANLIEGLHASVDYASQEYKRLQRAIPKVCRLVDERDKAIDWYVNRIRYLVKDNEWLEDALKTYARMLRGCADREASMLQWLVTLRFYLRQGPGSNRGNGMLRRLLRWGNHRDLDVELQRLQGISSSYGRNRSGEATNMVEIDITRPLSRRKLDDIIEVAEQNVRILQEDLEDLQEFADDGSSYDL